MGFVMLADLNAIGILASNFFLASYALMNLSCFHSEFTKPPRSDDLSRIERKCTSCVLVQLAASLQILQQVGELVLHLPLCWLDVRHGLDIRHRDCGLPGKLTFYIS